MILTFNFQSIPILTFSNHDARTYYKYKKEKETKATVNITLIQ